MQIIIKSGVENMDTQGVVDMLQATYWADDRSSEAIIKSMENSFCVGAFDETGEQVGFARVITDYATTYYVCDVIVKKSHQKLNIGSKMMDRIVNDKQLSALRGILATKDAHEFYKKFDFACKPELFMQRWSKVFK